MVIDTSALLAVLFDEPERDDFVRAIAGASHRAISVGTLIESSIVVESRRGEVAGRERLELRKRDVERRTCCGRPAGVAL